MDKPKVTPKDFFLWAGAVVSLYWSVIAYILLTFEYINYVMPNPLAYYSSDPYNSSIPYDMASIIVLFPIYLAVMWAIRRDITKDSTRGEIWVRRWALIFTLFVAGVTIAIDLIVLLTTFLSGEEITLAFILKVIIVLLVAAGVFMHFIADFWGYWTMYPTRHLAVFIGVGVLAFVTVVSGFFIVGTPMEARLYRFDDQKVSDLQSIQYQIANYYQLKQKLPLSLSDLSDPISNIVVPLDPQTGQQYEYSVVNGTSTLFSLCATFNKENRGKYAVGREGVAQFPTPAIVGIKGESNWQHGVGRVCFDRTIDPERYPQATPSAKVLR